MYPIGGAAVGMMETMMVIVYIDHDSIDWLKVRNLPKIDKGKKKNKEKETGKALESRLQVVEKFYEDDRSGGSDDDGGNCSL